MKKIIIVFMVLLSIMVTSCAARHDEELEEQNLDIKVGANTSFDDTIFISSTMRTSSPPPVAVDTSYTAERIREAILTDAVPNLSGGKVTIPEHTMKLDGDPLLITVENIKENETDVPATVGINMTLLKSTLKDIINDEWLDDGQKNKFLVDISTVKRNTTTDTKTSKKLETLIITFKAFSRPENQIAPDLGNKEYTIHIILNGENDKWQKEAPLSNIDLMINVNMMAINTAIDGKFNSEDSTSELKDKTIEATSLITSIKPVGANSTSGILEINIDITAATRTKTTIVADDIVLFVGAIIDGLDASRTTASKFTIKEDESKRKISDPTDNKILTIYLKPEAKDNFTLPTSANNKFYKVELTLTSAYKWEGTEDPDPVPIESKKLFTMLNKASKDSSIQLKMKSDPLSADNTYKVRYEAGTFISEGYVTKVEGGTVKTIIQESLTTPNVKYDDVVVVDGVSAVGKKHGTYTLTVTAGDGYIIKDYPAGGYKIILRVDGCTICNPTDTTSPVPVYCNIDGAAPPNYYKQ